MDKAGCGCEMHSPQHLAFADFETYVLWHCLVSISWAENAFTAVLYRCRHWPGQVDSKAEATGAEGRTFPRSFRPWSLSGGDEGGHTAHRRPVSLWRALCSGLMCPLLSHPDLQRPGRDGLRQSLPEPREALRLGCS